MLRRSRVPWRALLIVALCLVAVRAALPLVVEARVRAALAKNPRYAGSFSDVDVSVLRLAYTIEDLRLVKRNGKIPVPFVRAREVDYSFAPSALLLGKLRGEIAFSELELNLVDGPTPDVRQGPIGVDWRVTLRRLFPTRVNRFTVQDGALHFRNLHTDPVVDVYLADVQLIATNVASRGAPTSAGTVVIVGHGRTMETGSVRAEIELRRGTARPSFHALGRIENARLHEWNSLLRAYAGVDAESGRAHLSARLDADDGRLTGYVAPQLDRVEIVRFSEELAAHGAGPALREAVVGTVLALLKNRETDRAQARVPLTGEVRSPDPHIWAAIGSALRHAFSDGDEL